jgi:hypothetical protein
LSIVTPGIIKVAKKLKFVFSQENLSWPSLPYTTLEFPNAVYIDIKLKPRSTHLYTESADINALDKVDDGSGKISKLLIKKTYSHCSHLQ